MKDGTRGLETASGTRGLDTVSGTRGLDTVSGTRGLEMRAEARSWGERTLCLVGGLVTGSDDGATGAKLSKLVWNREAAAAVVRGLVGGGGGGARVLPN